MLLKNKMEAEVINGMEVPFQKELNERGVKAKAEYAHSQKCKKARERRNKQFNKVRVLYWNLMFLLSSICIISVGRLIYEIIRILKMQ
jgi:hypothetical protein